LKRRHPEIKLIWGRESEMHTLALFAVKNKPSGFDNNAIKSSIVQPDQNGRDAVTIALKKEFHAPWRLMTLRNIRNHIAICLDDQVLSSPIVYSEIPNGALVISGGQSGDSRLLAALLSADVLPVSLTVAAIDSALQPNVGRTYPTAAQIKTYENMRSEYIQYRHEIDSFILNTPVNLNASTVQRQIRRVQNEDLITIVDETGLTEAQVDQFLQKSGAVLQIFKGAIAPNAVQTQQSFFDSLSSLGPQ
jgi:hypothetical protein